MGRNRVRQALPKLIIYLIEIQDYTLQAEHGGRARKNRSLAMSDFARAVYVDPVRRCVGSITLTGCARLFDYIFSRPRGLVPPKVCIW